VSPALDPLAPGPAFVSTLLTLSYPSCPARKKLCPLGRSELPVNGGVEAKAEALQCSFWVFIVMVHDVHS
jgi:hypothetical protein